MRVLFMGMRSKKLHEGSSTNVAKLMGSVATMAMHRILEGLPILKSNFFHCHVEISSEF